MSETQRITKVCNEWEEKLVANAHLISEEIQVETFAVGRMFSFYVEGTTWRKLISLILRVHSRVQFVQRWVKADWSWRRDSLR